MRLLDLFETDTPASKLIADFHAAYNSATEQKLRTRSYVSIHASKNNVVVIDSIEVYQRSQGLGNKLMKLIMNLADQYGVILMLQPLSMHGRGDEDYDTALPQNELIQWYHRLGFDFEDKIDNWMVRRPNELNEAQFRKPLLMFHGTTTKFLRSILKNGVVPDPKEKYWSDQKDQGDLHSASRASYSGSYWTRNFMTAWSSSTSTVRGLGGMPMMVIAQISEGSALADEDSLKFNVERAFHDTIRQVYPGLSPEADGAIMMNFYSDYQGAREKLLSAFGPILHSTLKGTGPLDRRLTDAMFMAHLQRRLAHQYDPKYSGGIRYYLDRMNEPKPEIMSKADAEAEYRRVMDALTRRYRASAKRQTGDFNHTLRTEHVVGFRGANRITAIIQLQTQVSDGPRAEGESPSKTISVLWTSTPMMLHYGKVPEDFIHGYTERISDRTFPGILDRQGNWVVQPRPRSEVQKLAAYSFRE